jgi:Na+/H+ antiporter NhaB
VQPIPDIPRRLNTIQVLIRFLLRLVLVGTLASMGHQGFAQTLAPLLALTVIFCAIVAVTRREQLFGPVLTHWDEAAGYALMACSLPVLV